MRRGLRSPVGSSRAPLVDALRGAVLALTGASGSIGTGFFLAPGLVLTCAHVVGAASGTVTAQWRGTTFALTSIPEWYHPQGDVNGPDLALLQAPATLDHPVVCMAEAVEPGDELWGFGHPQGPSRDGDSVVLRAEGPSYRAGGGVTLHHASQGRVGPGFSGGPVINWRTGAVCGVLRLAYGLQTGTPGARLVPVKDVLTAFPFLPTPSASAPYRRDWLDLLDDSQLRAGQWRHAGPMLRSYLEWARQEASRHPYMIRTPGGHTPSLTSVYVPQRLTRENSSEHAIVHGEGPLPHQIGADEIMEEASSAIVVGDPGAGKSSLARHLTAELANTWLDGREARAVPVRVSAQAFSTARPFSETLRCSVEESVATRLRTQLPVGFFDRSPVPDVPWLVLVDGVDEIVDPNLREHLAKVVAELWSDQNYRFLITTRAMSDGTLQPLLERGAPVFRLLPFDADVLLEFAQRWFAGLGIPEASALAGQFCTALIRAELRELAGSPLLATMMCMIFAELPDGELPDTRADVYERFIQLLLSRMHHREVNVLGHLTERVAAYGESARASVNALVEGVRRLLEDIARDRIEATTYIAKETPYIALAEQRCQELRPVNMPQEEWYGLLHEVLTQTGLFVARDEDLAFLHQTLHSYLSACATARIVRPDSLEAKRLIARRVRAKPVESRRVPDVYLIFTFAIWKRFDEDTENLVLWLIEPQPRTDDFPNPFIVDFPDEFTVLAGDLLAEDDVLPYRVQARVLEAVITATRRSGLPWLADAVVRAHREVGMNLLSELFTGSQRPLYRRLETATCIAQWDRSLALSLLREAALHGMVFSAGSTGWREYHEGHHFEEITFPIPVDERIELTARIEAARTLVTIDRLAGLTTFEQMTSDTSLSLADRVRIAVVLAELDHVLGAHQLELLIPGATPESTHDPRNILLLAGRHHSGRERAEVLVSWATDQTRTATERVAVARAMALLDLEWGTRMLELMVAQPHFRHLGSKLYAAKELAAIDRDRAARALWELHKGFSSFDSHDAEITLHALAEIDHSAAVDAQLARIQEYGASYTAIDVLAQLAPEAAGDVALKIIADPHTRGFSRAKVAEALSKFDPNRAVCTLIDVIQTDPGASVDRLAKLLEELAPDRAIETYTSIALKAPLNLSGKYWEWAVRKLWSLDSARGADVIGSLKTRISGWLQWRIRKRIEALRKELIHRPGTIYRLP